MHGALAGQKFKLAAWFTQKSHPCVAASFLHWPAAGLSQPPAPARGTGCSFASADVHFTAAKKSLTVFT